MRPVLLLPPADLLLEVLHLGLMFQLHLVQLRRLTQFVQVLLVVVLSLLSAVLQLPSYSVVVLFLGANFQGKTQFLLGFLKRLFQLCDLLVFSQ